MPSMFWPVVSQIDSRAIQSLRNVSVRHELQILGHRLQLDQVLLRVDSCMSGQEQLEILFMDALRHCIVDVRIHPTHSHGNGVNALVSIGKRRVTTQSQQRVLARRVCGTRGGARLGGNGADVDDDAAICTVLQECRNDRAAGEIRPRDVDSHHAVPYFRVTVGNRRHVVHDAGVVDEDVQPAEFGEDGVDEGLDGGLVRYVGDGGEDALGFEACGGDPLLLSGLEAFGVDIADGHVSPAGKEAGGGCFAQSAACASDEDCARG